VKTSTENIRVNPILSGRDWDQLTIRGSNLSLVYCNHSICLHCTVHLDAPMLHHAHMPEPRKHCFCPRCNGALVSARTASCHAPNLTNSASGSVVPFPVWYEHNKQPPHSDFPNSDGSDSDSNTSVLTHSDVHVSKRRRYAMVCNLYYQFPYQLVVDFLYCLFIDYVPIGQDCFVPEPE